MGSGRTGSTARTSACATTASTTAQATGTSGAGTSTGYMLDTYPGNSLRMIVAEDQLRFDAKLPGKVKLGGHYVEASVEALADWT